MLFNCLTTNWQHSNWSKHCKQIINCKIVGNVFSFVKIQIKNILLKVMATVDEQQQQQMVERIPA